MYFEVFDVIHLHSKLKHIGLI